MPSSARTSNTPWAAATLIRPAPQTSYPVIKPAHLKHSNSMLSPTSNGGGSPHLSLRASKQPLTSSNSNGGYTGVVKALASNFESKSSSNMHSESYVWYNRRCFNYVWYSWWCFNWWCFNTRLCHFSDISLLVMLICVVAVFTIFNIA